MTGNLHDAYGWTLGDTVALVVLVGCHVAIMVVLAGSGGCP
ncbi:MAG: hypothetical protein ACO248_00800 [Burkholderiaceae bacterium]